MKYTQAQVKSFYTDICPTCKIYERCCVQEGLNDIAKHWIGNCPKFFNYVMNIHTFIADNIAKERRGEKIPH
jgi:hypothetical protein